MSSFNIIESVRNWNIKCAKQPAEPFTPEYWKALGDQAERLLEEAKELANAVKARDRKESVDALADIHYVLAGAVFQSQHEHDGAMKSVCENNDLKYFTTRSEAEEAAGKILQQTGEDIIVKDALFEGKTYYSIHRVSDSKVMKPVGHPKVDLSPFIAGAEVFELFAVQKPACAICAGLIINLTKTLGITKLTVLEPFSSQADNDFCVENGLTVGDVAYYNGCTLVKTNYGTEQFDIRRVERWLKKVGAL